jgi:hypothetical protein
MTFLGVGRVGEVFGDGVFERELFVLDQVQNGGLRKSPATFVEDVGGAAGAAAGYA